MAWPGKPWTAERKAELKRRWEAGESASEIGRAMGCTRNAVCGQVHRMGLYRTEAVRKEATVRFYETRKPRTKKAVSVRRETRPRPNNFAGVNVERVAQAKRRELPAPVLSDASAAKPWLERAFGECTWIVSGVGAEAVSCCKPVDRRGWCSEHAALGLRPMKIHPDQWVKFMARRAA